MKTWSTSVPFKKNKMKIEIKNNSTYIDNILINDKIFDEEMFEYRVEDKDDLIDNLIMWIGESKSSDRQLMKDDLKYIIGLNDEYIFSSISTNEYVSLEDSNFKELCEELLELNSSMPSKEEILQEMELHNADEVGINNQWTFEDAEYHLLLSDKYHKK